MAEIKDDGGPLLRFPCEFPIKAIGKATPEFQGAVLAVFRKHVPELGEGAITEHYSAGNNYLSLTITITATSQEQLDAIYSELSRSEHVVMAL